jgi:hypothetical protein
MPRGSQLSSTGPRKGSWPDEVNVDRQVVGSVRRMTVRLHRQLVTLRSLIQRFEHDIEEEDANPAISLPTEKLGQPPRLARHGNRRLPLVGDPSGFLWVIGIIAAASAFVYWLLKRSGTVGR